METHLIDAKALTVNGFNLLKEFDFAKIATKLILQKEQIG